jgi:hypothetical protein
MKWGRGEVREEGSKPHLLHLTTDSTLHFTLADSSLHCHPYFDLPEWSHFPRKHFLADMLTRYQINAKD